MPRAPEASGHYVAPANWSGSSRRERLPSNWRALRRTVLDRVGGRCQELVETERCTRPATDVDHIVRGNDHSLPNLRALCQHHHRSKSGREGAEARLLKGARDG